MLRFRFGLLSLPVAILCGSAWATDVFAAAAVVDEQVKLVSANVGLMFFEPEPVKVDLQVRGPLSRGELHYTAEQFGGEWKAQGSLKIERIKDGETRNETLAINFPGQGLYRMRVQGSLGSHQVNLDRNLSLLTSPPPIEAESPWGISYIPSAWFDAKNPHGPADVAKSLRGLGASWIRFGFWENSFGEVSVVTKNPGREREIKMGATDWKDPARELHEQGFHIMSGMAMMPRALSSKPNDERVFGDGPPGWGRVPPADYELWEKYVEYVARAFKDEVEVWEIWNEPENHGVYFSASIEEFMDLVKHTSVALRRGNPQTKVAACGFTRDRVAFNWGNRLFELGLADAIDIFTVHYTDGEAIFTDRWQEILRAKHANLPIWNSEERSVVPIFDRIHGIPHSFKFLHVNIGYEDSGPLVEKDYTLRPEGMEFAVGARCLTSARFVRSLPASGGTLHLFQRGVEIIGVFQREALATYLHGKPPELRLKGTLLPSKQTPVVTTSYGRRLTPQIDGNGVFTVDASEALIFINDCSSLEVVPSVSPAPFLVAEAEQGAYSSEWHVIEHRGASQQHALEMWGEETGGASGHHVEVKFNVPVEGNYELLFAGSPLADLKSPRSICPFKWSLGDQPEKQVNAPIAPLADSALIEGGLYSLGTVNLKAGQQTLRMRVTASTEANPKYRLVVDAFVLRPTSSK